MGHTDHLFTDLLLYIYIYIYIYISYSVFTHHKCQTGKYEVIRDLSFVMK
jgi:hypothetical protein